jgi:CBS domain-containing protein
MSSTVHTCTPDDDTESLMRIMTERRIRHVPVVDGGRLSGIVSIGDVVKDRIEELEKNKTELIEYITAR